NALQEMSALLGKWLALGDIDGYAVCVFRCGEIFFPSQLMGVEDQLTIPCLRIVEDSHALAADKHELLLLEGMEPRDEDMGPLAALEADVQHRHIGDCAVQV